MNSKLQKIRSESINSILDILSENKLGSLHIYDIDAGCSPILQEDAFDDNNTYTLDEIRLMPNGSIVFDGSNCSDNFTWTEDNISTDALIGIEEFLEEHIYDIKEYAETEED